MTENELLTSAIQIFGSKVLSRISQSEVCNALGLCDQKQMAARLGLTYEAFRWRVARGSLPKPAVRLAKRAYYTAEQVEALVQQEAQSNNVAATVREDNHNGSSKE
jgi:hypothetical protein